MDPHSTPQSTPSESNRVDFSAECTNYIDHYQIPELVKFELGKNKVLFLGNEGVSFRSADNANKPYTNNGRTKDVWKVLFAFGISRNADGRPTPAPNPCFELWARHPNIKACTENELADFAPRFVRTVRRTPVEQLGYIGGDEEGRKILGLSDAELLVYIAGSEEGVKERFEKLWYFSFCWLRPVQTSSHWHCKICKKCRDWMSWHCANCDKCTYGQGIPCPGCMPMSFEKYKDGYIRACSSRQ